MQVDEQGFYKVAEIEADLRASAGRWLPWHKTLRGWAASYYPKLSASAGFEAARVTLALIDRDLGNVEFGRFKFRWKPKLDL